MNLPQTACVPYFVVWPWGMWGPSSLSRDQTHTSYTRHELPTTEFQGSPTENFKWSDNVVGRRGYKSFPSPSLCPFSYSEFTKFKGNFMKEYKFIKRTAEYQMFKQMRSLSIVWSRGYYQEKETVYIQTAPKISVPYLMWLNILGSKNHSCIYSFIKSLCSIFPL